MIVLESGARQQARERIERLHTAEQTVAELITKAMDHQAEASTRLAIGIMTILPGADVLADYMSYRGGRISDRFAEIAALIAGEPGDQLTALIYHYRDAEATIVLERVEGGLNVRIEVTDAQDLDRRVIDIALEHRVETINKALWTDIPVVYK